MKEIGKLAERNLQLKRSRELSNEFIKIVKNMAKSEEPTQLDKIVAEFDSKESPKEVKTIFDENLSRISELDRNNPEYNVIL